MFLFQCAVSAIIAFIGLGLGFFACENAVKIGHRTYGRNVMTAIFSFFSVAAMSGASAVWTGSRATHLFVAVAAGLAIWMFSVTAKPVRHAPQQAQQ